MPKGRKAPPGDCSLPHPPAYTTKDGAELAGGGGRAKRCGRCRRWYVPGGRR